MHPNFLHEDCGGDIDALGDFLENLHDDECGIIERHGKDPKKLRRMKQMSDRDIANTAKDLAME